MNNQDQLTKKLNFWRRFSIILDPISILCYTSLSIVMTYLIRNTDFGLLFTLILGSQTFVLLFILSPFIIHHLFLK